MIRIVGVTAMCESPRKTGSSNHPQEKRTADFSAKPLIILMRNVDFAQVGLALG